MRTHHPRNRRQAAWAVTKMQGERAAYVGRVGRGIILGVGIVVPISCETARIAKAS
jgi:hypothetical protein